MCAQKNSELSFLFVVDRI